MTNRIETKRFENFYNNHLQFAKTELRKLSFAFIFNEDDFDDISLFAFTKLDTINTSIEKKLTKPYFSKVLFTCAVDHKNKYYPSVDIGNGERQSIQTLSIENILNDVKLSDNLDNEYSNDIKGREDVKTVITHIGGEDKLNKSISEAAEYNSVLLYAAYTYRKHKDGAMMRRVYSQFISKELKMHQSLYEPHEELGLSIGENEIENKGNYIIKHIAIQRLLGPSPE
jgi:hypothetical protein